MKILSVFPDFPWLNKSCFLITHTLTWKKPFQSFFAHNWDFHKKSFWILLIKSVVCPFLYFLPFDCMKQNLKLVLLSDKWNTVSHHEILFNLVRKKKLLSRSRNKILLLPSADCDCILAQEQLLTKWTRLCWSYSSTKGYLLSYHFRDQDIWSASCSVSLLTFEDLGFICSGQEISMRPWFFFYVSASVFWWVNKLKK